MIEENNNQENRNPKSKTRRKRMTWKIYHRWFGLVLSVFMLVFCVSGIILNHRQFFSGCCVSRAILPPAYHIKDFNNGIVKGTISLQDEASGVGKPLKDSVLVYGYAGIFFTDSQMKHWRDGNAGLPESVDERNIRHVVRTKDGTLWCAALYDVYRYDNHKMRWERVALKGNEERISDVALNADSTQVVAISRSKVFLLPDQAKIIKAPNGYVPKTSLFKTVWHLHSGEFLGVPGKLVVDAIAIVLIILSLTGIRLFILPYRIRRYKKIGKAKDKMKKLGKRMVCDAKWHNRLGYATIVLTLWVAITGMCLRPPLMVPLVLTQYQETVGEDGNVWKDKLRAIRWDEAHQCWLVSTSDGFLRVDKDFRQKPILLSEDESPKVSPMGVTVFESDGKGGWIVGSFRGMFHWSDSGILDYFTGKPSVEHSMIPISDHLVSGYSQDFFSGKPLVFDYAKGVENEKGEKETVPLGLTPKLLSETPMSLWNVALELHVGRCYSPFLGPISNLFVFLSGLLISLVLISGYIILHRRKRKSKVQNLSAKPSGS